jgi:hypothetical protein
VFDFAALPVPDCALGKVETQLSLDRSTYLWATGILAPFLEGLLGLGLLLSSVSVRLSTFSRCLLR